MAEQDDPEVTRLGRGARIAISVTWIFALASLVIMLGGSFPLALGLSLPGWIAVVVAFILGWPRRRVLALVALPILALLFVCWPILFLSAVGLGVIDAHQ